MKNLKKMSYAFVMVASICFAAGVAVLSSDAEGDKTQWKD